MRSMPWRTKVIHNPIWALPMAVKKLEVMGWKALRKLISR